MPSVTPERFDIVRSLGTGGMGMVHEAVDRASGTRVALKTLHERDGHALYRFKREFRALADVAHPNLVQLYELIVESDGACLFTMELVDDAVDLMRFLRGQSWDAPTRDEDDAITQAPSHRRPIEVSTREVPPDAPRVRPPTTVDQARLRVTFRQLAEGVDALHRAGKLHRDLKPSNVLVRPDGRVAILDFGLTADLRDDAAPTTKGSPPTPHYDATDRSISGTAHYMSPEQAQARALTPASDWFSVGVMLFEALTGRRPIEGDSLPVLVRKAVAPAVRPSSYVDGVATDLDVLCHALLHLDPERRPGAAEILATFGGTAVTPPTSAPFVGRDDALAKLESAFERSRTRPVLVHVRGASGVGKSTLVARFLERHADDAWICEGRCFERETVPFKALDGVVDGLVGIVAHVPLEERARWLPEEIGALVRMFPSVARITDRTETGAPDTLRARALEALAALVSNLAEVKPVIVHVDDLQWGDEGGARLLGDLLTTDAPLLLIVGSRAEHEGRSAALRALDDVARNAASTVLVELGRLDEAAAVALVEAIAPKLDPTRVAWVVREAEGNAFFLHELARAADRVADTDAVRLDALLADRVAELDPDSRALLETCAVAARPLPLRVANETCARARRTSDAERPPLGPDAVLTLRREHLARSTGPSLDEELETFHDRVREVVVASLSAERRRALHAALARTLAALPNVQPEALAAHHEAAGERDSARRLYVRAADLAARALAFDRAEHFTTRALALADDEVARAEVRERRVHFLTNLGHFADAYAEGRLALAEAGVAIPVTFSPPALFASLAKVVWLARGRDAAVLAALPEARQERTRRAVRLLAATMKAAYQVRPELCVTLANESVALCLRDGNTPDCAIGYMVHGAIFRGGVLGRHATGHAYGKVALELVERYGNEAQRAEVSFVVAYFATAWTRPAEEAEALFARALAAGLRAGDDFHAGCAAAAIGMSRVMRGAPLSLVLGEGEEHLAVLRARRLDEAAATLESALALARALHDGAPMPETATDEALARYGSRHLAHFQLLAAAIAAWHRGDERRTRAQLARAEALLPDARGMLHSAEHVFWRAITASRNDPLLAVDALRLTRWAREQPENFGAKSALVNALLPTRPRGPERFEHAIRIAAVTRRPHVAAIARELARRRG